MCSSMELRVVPRYQFRQQLSRCRAGHLRECFLLWYILSFAMNTFQVIVQLDCGGRVFPFACGHVNRCFVELEVLSTDATHYPDLQA